MEINLNEISEALPYFYNQNPDSKNWWLIGKGLASLGEQGRSYFIDISLNQNGYPDKAKEEKKANSLFNTCLRDPAGKGLFFAYAIKYGYKKNSTNKKRKIVISTPAPITAPKVDLELLEFKRKFLENFMVLFPEETSKDNYFSFTRKLSLGVVKTSQIRTFSTVLNVYDNNTNKKLKRNEDEKTIYNLIKYRVNIKDLLVSLTCEILKIDRLEAEKILLNIRVLHKEKKLFQYYMYNHFIPAFNPLGKLQTIQFIADQKARDNGMNKYSFLSILPGETQPLFCFPANFQTYDRNKTLYLTEGIIDALSLKELSKQNQSLPLFTANFTVKPEHKHELEAIREFKKVVFLPDRDDAGHEATIKLSNCLKFELKSYKKLAIQCRVNPDNIKDANDILKELRKA